MKKVVFVSQRINGYADEIIKVMEEKLGYEVLFIENRYGYKNILEKLIGNLIYKPLLRKNYKTEKYCDEAIKKIEKFGEFDEIFFINPEEASEKIIKYLQKTGKPMRAHLWDSIKFMRDIEKYLRYFPYKTSFDPEDCKNYSMKFLPNFYIDRFIKSAEKKYDFFCVMMYDERFTRLEILAKKLKEQGKNYLFMILDKEKKVKSEYLTIINEPISIEKVYSYMNESRGIVELGREQKDKEGKKVYQGGLTFRAIESLGSRTKLITDYGIVKEYDFYNEKNINIIPREGEYNLEKEFLDGEYQTLQEEIYNKYSCESWVKTIFEKE
ncbi:MAG: hypothetical protein ACRCZH_02100 [Cetobacterium sp.]